jgi:hypothetical protein
MNRNALIAVAIMATQCFDVLSTNTILAAGGNEANPIMASVMDSWGSAWPVPKLLVAASLCMVVLKAPRISWKVWLVFAISVTAPAWNSIELIAERWR